MNFWARRKWGWLLAALFCLPSPLWAAGSNSLTLYAGRYSDDRLGDVLLSKPVTYMNSWLLAVAASHAFALASPAHQWELEGQLARHVRGQHHWETNLLAIYRWQRFSWRRVLQTSLAVGEGLSYASRVPPLEAASQTNVGATRLLNYILVEMTVAPPQVKDWSLVVRVHHRSGVYGLFNDVKGGSNVIAAGVKFYY
jgi:hypothetical protein